MSDAVGRAPVTLNESNAASALVLVDDDKASGADSNSNSNSDSDDDLFSLPAAEALRLLSASVELLVRMTGDVPPTPPPRAPTNPQMSDLQVEKENINMVRSRSQRSLLARQGQQQQQQQQQAEATAQQPAGAASTSTSDGMNKLQAYSASMSAQLIMAQKHQGGAASTSATTTTTTRSADAYEPVDGVQLRHRPHPPPEPEPEPEPPQPYIIIGADSRPVNLQHGAITRKFYSKKEPPISINHYLARLHQFCPMSTAVYLATSLYIHRLAVEERAIPVTRRNAHRLVLAGLRVAMKALEDLSYPHAKIARVGGVSEVELARLEISFCFLAGFELVVGEDLLRSHWEELRGRKAQAVLGGNEVPTLRLGRRPREVPPASG